jgi:DNA-directed RNA polymerase specialized sigma24 family protein
MTSAADVFVAQLGRASRRATRFVEARGLGREDREEVIANALAWCWENRERYPLTTTIEQWFFGAVRNAYRSWLNGELKESAEALSEVPTGDTTLARVDAESAARELLHSLPARYHQIARMEMAGCTRREMKEIGIREREIREARARIRELRTLVPDEYDYRRVLRTAPAPSSDEPREIAQIDRDIEQLQRGGDDLAWWVHSRTGGEMNRAPEPYVAKVKPLETHASRMRKLLNKRAGLEESFMPTYVPPKHWRS